MEMHIFTGINTHILVFLNHWICDLFCSFRDQLRQRYNQQQYYLEVNMDDLRSFDEELADDLIASPAEFMSWVNTTFNFFFFV